ncbi:hypothetical protein DACRYDRAFT_44497 [Dacryopinax primogenitus]|uniref:Uncharacterized protein n=1 Tax=Dacryopinax primogenitus (strain DJM 731) TaxID=1858805 RepID=M5GGU5_DACPD|nr:uncharacterized protein DACRYDRAFT_44497 [Dacryopinax primogenitus]EJU06098.1 hypothetical protein DACRYDRAFT_44497 [Dacryopinax primogenitus]
MSVFLTCASMPDVLYFDNNCNLCQHLENCLEDVRQHFAHTTLIVDMFHWNGKHLKDEYCNMYCNLALYPELCNEGKRNKRFGTQTQEMTPVWYEFFLDEVIKAHNEDLERSLCKSDQFPHHIPACKLQ